MLGPFSLGIHQLFDPLHATLPGRTPAAAPHLPYCLFRRHRVAGRTRQRSPSLTRLLSTVLPTSCRDKSRKHNGQPRETMVSGFLSIPTGVKRFFLADQHLRGLAQVLLHVPRPLLLGVLMNDRLAQHQPSPSQTESRMAAPRTLVNSSATAPYIPSKTVPLRAGADDHKRQPTRGQRT